MRASYRAMRRRDFLSDLGRLSLLCAGVPNIWRVDWRASVQDNPFSLGVASGDPTSTGVVLWTRLAPRPLEPAGGLPPEPIDVQWELAGDETMRDVIRSGTAVATPQLGHSVHAEVEGLEPDRWYWYRFRAGDAESPVGRTRT